MGEEEAIRRYAAYFPHRAPLVPGSDKCRKWQAKMNNLSDYMKHVQQSFSRWYNRTRKARRKGALWGQRYKNTLLGDGASVLRCWTDGLVIGSEKFVREMMCKARGIPVDSGHSLMCIET